MSGNFKGTAVSDNNIRVFPLLQGSHSAVHSRPEETVISKMELMDTLKEMQKLPPQMREVIYLRTAAELSFRGIGEVLGKE